MNSFLLADGPRQRIGALFLLLTGAGLVSAFYGIWSGVVTPPIAVVIALLPQVLGLAVVWPAIALAGMTALISVQVPQNLSVQFGLPSLMDVAVPGAVLVLILRQLMFDQRPMFSGKALLGLAVLLGWSGFTIFYAHDWQIAQNTTFSMAKDFVIVLVVLGFIDGSKMLGLFFSVLIVAFGAICATGIYLFATGGDNSFFGFVRFAFTERRFTGPFLDANFFGSYLVLLIPVSVGIAFGAAGPWQRLPGLVGLGLLTGGLLLTASRGGLVAVLSALPFFLFFLSNRARMMAVAISLVGIVSIAAILTDPLANRFAFLVDPTAAAPDADLAVEGRLASWRVAQELFVDHPVFGVGVGNFNTYYQDVALENGLMFRGEGRSAHSLYFETLAEQGLIGLFLLAAVLIVAISNLVGTARRLEDSGRVAQAMQLRGLVIGLLAMFFARIFLHDAYINFFWLAVAVALASDRIFQTGGTPTKER